MINKFIKYKKKLLIFAGILIVIGFVILLTGFGMLGFDINNLSPNYAEYTQTEKFYEIDKGKPLDLSIDTDSADVYIKPSEDDNIKLFFSPEYFSVEFNTNSASNDSLIISRNESYRSNRKWYYLINVYTNSYDKITIEVPKKLLGDLSVKLKYGTLNISEISDINSLFIDNNSTDIELNNLQILKNADISSDYGDISISNSNIDGKCSIEEKSGNLHLNNNYINNSEILLKYGNSKLVKTTGSSLYIKASSGNVNLNDVKMKASLSVDSTYGDILLNYADSSLIELISKSGNIKGKINDFEEAYKISAFSKSGNSNLHSKHAGHKELKVECNYGDINIKFNE